MAGKNEEDYFDQATLSALEFPRIVRELAARVRTVYGQQKAEVLQPARDPETVLRWQDETGETLQLHAQTGDFLIETAPDITQALSRAKLLDSILPGNELYALWVVLDLVRRIKQQLEGEDDYPRLRALAYFLDPCPELAASLRKSLEPSGEVRDDASPDLGRIRRSIRELRQQIYEHLQSFLAKSELKGIVQDEVVTLRSDRYVVPIKRDSAGAIKGIIHGYSASGATAFVEPLFLVGENNQLADLHAAEKDEVERILRHLTGLCGIKQEEIAQNLEIIGHLDLLQAKAVLAKDLHCTRPGYSADGLASLTEARHPILVLKFNAALPAERKPVIPIDIAVGGKVRALVISGSNTGGKTVALKTLGLLALMYQAGMQVPAHSDSVLPVFTQIWANIGDEQSIDQSVSTFSSHIAGISKFLHGRLDKALVLLDEVGVGTDPRYGSAIAQAVLERVLDEGGCVVATTHYDLLKEWATQTRGAANASVLFDPETMRPTYRLRMGAAGSSNALGIARLLGMPEEVMARAEELVGEEQLELDRLLRSAQEERLALERMRVEGAEDRRQVLEEIARLGEERERLRLSARKEMERARTEMNIVLTKARNTVDAAIKAITEKEISKAEAKKRLQEMEKAARELRAQLEAAAPGGELAPEAETATTGAEIRVGDQVTVGYTGARGEVLEIDAIKKRAVVMLGSVRATLELSALRKVEPEPKKRPHAAGSEQPPEEAPSSELNIIGMRVAVALPLVEELIDHAYRTGVTSLRIVHGKGTGRLRQAIREMLKANGMVASYHDGPPEAGGSGITEVVLES
jgi:DNA mismatch repair protein MutS2